MSEVKEKKDNFLKNFFKKIENLEDTKKHKIAKIISFVVGACFDFLGIVAVAIWKYLFCSKEQNSKYCIRLSIFGMIVKYIVFAKLLFSFTLPVFAKKIETYYNKPYSFSNYETPNNYKINNKKTKYSYKIPYEEEPFFLESFNDDIFDFSFDMDRELKKINESFKKQTAIMNKIIKEQQDEIDKINAQKEKKLNIKKDVKTENGYETTTIEKTGPNIYQKSVNVRYVGNNKNVAKENSKKKEKSYKKNNSRFFIKVSDKGEEKYNESKNIKNKKSSSTWSRWNRNKNNSNE